MGGKLGINVYIEVFDSIGLSWVRPAKQESGTLTRNADTVDTTNKDDAGWRQFLAGNRGFEVTFTALFDETDPGYLLLEDAFNSGDAINTRVWDGTRYHTGDTRVTDLGVEAPDDDAARYTPTLTGDGELVIT